MNTAINKNDSARIANLLRLLANPATYSLDMAHELNAEVTATNPLNVARAVFEYCQSLLTTERMVLIQKINEETAAEAEVH